MSKLYSTVFSRHYQELKKSFIDDLLISLNVNSSEGFQLQSKYFEYWQGDRTNTGRPAGRLLEKTNHLLAGAWFVYFQTKQGLIPHFKPDNPRPDKSKEGKYIKYEQILGVPNGTFIPRITYHHIKLIAERNNIKIYPKGDLNACYEDAWKWISTNKKIKIGITEGAKKSMALMSVGVPAIALSGVWNFHNSKVDKKLLETFHQFKGHKFCFYYDNDKKEKTINHVAKAAQKLIKQISILGISKEFEKCTWSNTNSKGIDDYLFDYDGDERHLKYEDCLFGETFQKVTPDLTLNSRYLTDKNKKCLPEITEAIDNNKVTAILSAKGTGKTAAISDYTAQYSECGIKILVPTHRVQLMSELSSRFQIANAFNHRESLDEVFGLSLCVDSMRKNSSVKFDIERFADCILVIDEIDQVLDHLVNSSTEVRKHRPVIIENFIMMLKIASKVIVSSADITQDVIDFLEANTGEKVFIVENQYKDKIGTCHIYTQTQPQVFLGDLYKAIDRGDNICFFTSSQRISSSYSTQNLEILLKKQYPHIKVMRIDAHTVVDPQRREFNCMNNINEFIETEIPDVLLISPVLETGIDITSEHFDSYWGMSWGITPVNSFSQAMARIRKPIPRYIWSSSSSSCLIGNGSLFASGLISSQKNQLKVNELIFHHFDDNLDVYINDSCLTYWATRGAITNTHLRRLVKSVIAKFASDYKTIRINNSAIKKEEKCKLKQIINANKITNIQAQYDQIIASPLLTDSDFQKLKDKKQKTLDERLMERKNSLVRYITPKSKKLQLTHSILQLDDAKLLPKINLHWLLTLGLEVTHKFDKLRLNDKEFSIDLNKKCMALKVAYLTRFNVIEIINNPDEFYFNKHLLINEVGSNIRCGFKKLAEADFTIKDLWSIRYLSIESFDIHLVKWCLSLLGFELKSFKRVQGVVYFSLFDLAMDNRKMLFDFWNTERFDSDFLC
ncbi:MAG: DUF3854 domain-containing protein [Okeania sp. SIO3I5]|uniref:plasmid replication protein, CyRepA1 family n=1 Tax=Okeania sp. SIO3I5 TaxID=2607805 RepID=UPI0013BD79DA|nr:plasmid replication protein, CyRepA1 family [Okeania sp. SIO3I5]NEQ41555.1 DUF3854 domain-containing protein [Okeania sp. SIO3I5]